MQKITDSQYDVLLEMFKNGAIFEEAAAYLGITKKEAYDKRNPYSDNLDKKFAKALELGEVYSSVYWFKQRKEESPRNWQYIMKSQFGWCAQNKRGPVSQIKYDPDDPATTMDCIIQAVATDEVSPEKAKALTDTILNSYYVRRRDAE